MMKWLCYLALCSSIHVGRWLVLVSTVLGVSTWAGRAQAQEAFATTVSPGRNTFEGQLMLALPAWLPVGLSEGVGLGFSRLATSGGLLAWGARASWSTATEYPLGYLRRNDDVRMRVFGAIQHHAGRGSFGLRLSVGGTAVYDKQTVAQGARADLAASELEQSSWHFFPGGDLEGFVVLRIWQSWGMSIGGGPTLHLIDRSTRAGWTSSLGVTWQH